MAKRCPPGVICFENVTIIILVIFILIAFYYYSNRVSNISQTEQRREIIVNEPNNSLGLFSRPNYSFSNIPNDILLNPYAPPYVVSAYQ